MTTILNEADQTLFDSVCDDAREAMLLQTIADTMEWDGQTGLPTKAGDYRADQVSMLRGEVHAKRTASSYGDRLIQLAETVKDADPHSDVAATVIELHRDYDRNRRLPADLVRATSMATVRGQQKWEAARKADDFSLFRDSLIDIVKLKREAGDCISDGTDRSCYEALLDEYEPGARVDQLQATFDSLRGPLVELIAAIKDAPKQSDVSILQRSFPIDAQREFSKKVSAAIGFDFQRGRLDETSHPFCTTLGPNDIRILTRFEQHWLPGGLFGTLHEAGHGMYEQGLRADWFGLPPGSYVSLGMHESQSRLWENQVGRSREFWTWLLDDAKAAFEPSIDDVGLDSFYHAVNTIRPSLIRVEADEATYNLHILIRFDLERQLIERHIEVADLPDAWNARYESDLGITPPSDADGVLQDVHWSAGLIGYFPTYTLGNLASAQLYEAAEQSIGDLPDQISRGDFGPLADWLRTNVHESGRCYSSDQLIKKVTGKPLSAKPLMNYLTLKLSPLYGLV
ncbi:Thermostable carboxypeptidase 1 [Rubripirellula obstinata]|uniref:Metal-dependent carboxypeptidase n=1 Tax=Rubripirellula obstinata TaxID=406547 RepID=A0A5B1CCF5_9BACT|nr:carboxypeptidase M32 [Rubripirellula obstinata]KAA1257705.1 Thermostable carboxypeptidase 1 [Rubripirellula obstinata]